MGARFAHVLAERVAERVERLVDAHRGNVAKHGHTRIIPQDIVW
jgi:hypothetical protein